MKRKTTAIICLTAFFLLMPASWCTAFAEKDEQPSVSASAAVLFCVNSGEFLFEKNADTQMPMASTTKVMTSLLALEASAAENKTVTFTKDMIAEGSSMYLKEGNKLKLSDLAVGMMMVSGNDAANAAALTVGKTYEKFAGLMNARAQQIGMKNTHFVTPSGLDDEQHYSTAHDMALLLDCAMQNDTFAKISAQKSMKVGFAQPKDQTYTYGNHNRLLSLYEYCTGGKTGFTKIAGRCLVSSAEKDGVKLIAVTLRAPDDWNDHINLFNYGFSRLARASFDDTAYHIQLPLTGSDKDKVNVSAYATADVVVKNEDKDRIEREVSLPPFVYAPVEAGEVLGKIYYKLDGKVIAMNELVADGDYPYIEEEKGFFAHIADFFKNLFGG